MAIAILQLGDVELRTTDSLTCRTLFRLMNTAVRDEELDDMVNAPVPSKSWTLEDHATGWPTPPH